MRRFHVLSLAVALVAAAGLPAIAAAQRGGGGAPPSQPQQAGGEGAAPANAAARRAPRPYAQVIPARAHTEHGGITVHRVDDRWFFEVPDSLFGRDFLMVSRLADVPAGTPGLTPSGASVAERMVRWTRAGERVLLQVIPTNATADDSLPIAQSVRENYYGPILAAFPIQAFTADSTGYVVDVTDFFGGDTPALSGLNANERRTYGVRRYDAARSYVSTVRSFPINVEVRHVQTYDAADPPDDRGSGTVSLEMRQSIVLLPKVPMRPRYFDPRVGFFTVSHINYGLDEQKAATQTFIARWRLEPKDPAAYARGELVEPIKPITYYIDPATPRKWRRYVKEGVEAWQKEFEKAGFKNAILAKDPPTKEENPDWDPDDARISMVRWAASLVRNAEGPHTSDPRSGEILNSEIFWFHNHMRSYRNRLMVETGAANPSARTLDIPEELMGETMRQVITHEIGHAIGLQHNMVASNTYPVDSLRSPTFTHVYGVSATIMDYARQNYVAQPGDGLQPKDFIRRLGPFDEFVINWGYRALPQAKTAEAERPTLSKWITDQKGFFAYHYVPQQLGSLDPRAQTEDVGDDAVKATSYALMNMKKVIPNLITWTSHPGDDYEDLNELYGEALGMWSLYMGHVTTWVGGITVDLKSADQAGVVYKIVPQARQKTALAFLSDNVFSTPQWLQPQEIVARIGPSGLAARQATVLTSLMTPARLSRMADAEKFDAAAAYPVAEFLSDLKRDVWGTPGTGAAPDANRRMLQRVYLDRLGAIIHPPAPGTAAAGAGGRGGGGGGAAAVPPPFLAPPNVERSDLPALARAQLRDIQREAKGAAASAQGAVMRAHWADVADRVDAILKTKE
jgi:hypothetical protein